MSCSVCAGYDDHNCPCCGEGPILIPCPECTDGYAYFAGIVGQPEARVKVTKLAYMMLPYDEDDAKGMRQRYYQIDIEVCPVCEGEQEVRKR